MKIDREKLLAALSLLSKVTEKRGNFPVLSCVYIDGPGQRIMATNLNLTAIVPLAITDYEKDYPFEVVPVEPVEKDLVEGLNLDQLKQLAADYKIEMPKKVTEKSLAKAIIKASEDSIAKETAKQPGADGKFREVFVLPAQMLKKVVASIMEKEVTITAAKTEARDSLIAQPHVVIGQNFQNVPTLPMDEYPVIVDAIKEEADTLTVTKDHLKMVNFVAPGGEETGFRLNGVFFDAADGKAVTTDGHRLHMVPATAGKDAFIPRDFINLVLQASNGEKDLTFKYDETYVRATMKSGAVLLSRLMESKFPDYKAVIPKNRPHFVRVERFSVEQALKQALTISDSSKKAVALKFNGGIDIRYENSETGTYQKVSIPVKKGLKTGEEFEVGVNATYLLDALGTTASKTDEVKISMAGVSDPLIFEHGDFLGVVMPVRL